MKQIINSLLFLLTAIIIISSCYDHTEGCRDINALNFDVSADKDCENNCCNYPDVVLKVALLNDSSVIDTNTILVNSFNDTFRIKYFRMYLSGFKFLNSANDTIPVLNPITIGHTTGTDTIFESINLPVIKIKTKSQSYKIGKINKLDIYNNMIMDFGLPPVVNHGNTNKVPVSNPLYKQNNDMYIDSTFGYYFLKMKIVKTDSTTIYINLTGDKYFKKIELENKLDLSQRKNHNLYLDIDINKWIIPINLDDNLKDIKNSLFSNINKSFYLYKK